MLALEISQWLCNSIKCFCNETDIFVCMITWRQITGILNWKFHYISIIQMQSSQWMHLIVLPYYIIFNRSTLPFRLHTTNTTQTWDNMSCYPEQNTHIYHCKDINTEYNKNAPNRIYVFEHFQGVTPQDLRTVLWLMIAWAPSLQILGTCLILSLMNVKRTDYSEPRMNRDNAFSWLVTANRVDYRLAKDFSITCDKSFTNSIQASNPRICSNRCRNYLIAAVYQILYTYV